LDLIDNDILKILQKNGRISMKNLGKKVGLSAPAVSERVKKLEEKGIIEGYRAVVNPKKMGKSVEAFINISMKPKNRKNFMQFVENNNNIITCYHVTGTYCMVIKALFEEMIDLEMLIDKLQEYGDTNTLIILSTPLKRKLII